MTRLAWRLDLTLINHLEAKHTMVMLFLCVCIGTVYCVNACDLSACIAYLGVVLRESFKEKLQQTIVATSHTL